MIIDFHTHCYPDAIAEKCVPMMEKTSGFKAHGDGTFSGLKANMRAEGIDYSVILPVATKPTQVEKMNDIAFTQNGQRGIFSFGAMHPDYENRVAEFRRMKEHGLKGIKLHCDYVRRYVDSEEIISLINDAFSEGLMVVIHAGSDPVSPDIHYTSVPRIARMLDRVTEGTMILAHYGGLYTPEDVLQQIVGRNVYLDTSTGHFISDRKPLTEIVKRHDPDKLLYASDLPWFSQAATLTTLQSMDLSQETLDKICYKNAARLLGLSENMLLQNSLLTESI